MWKRPLLVVLSFIAALSVAELWGLPAAAQGSFSFEAVAGQPFGVGRISFDLSAEMLPEPLGIEGIGLTEKHGRVLYPAIDNPAFARLLRGLLESDTPLTSGGPVREVAGGVLRGILDRPPHTTIFFLFSGAEPLELSVETRTPIPLHVVPRVQPRLHARLMDLWWRHYAKPPGLLDPKPEYPIVEDYLTAMLARRLSFRLPERRQIPSAYDQLRQELGLNVGTESLRMAMLQDRMLGLNNLSQPADQPIPPPFEQPELQVPEMPANVAVEPIAARVPAECFYVRFGSFDNFLWLQDTLAKWGGDAQNLIALRGIDRGISRRFETQLSLKQTVLSRMLGPTVVADVAIIGTDMFFREGAAYGLLFHARNNFALSTSIGQQRIERVNAGGATEQRVKIDDHVVSYLASPDGTVRSYFVSDGDFHFVTSSKELARRFLATASGKGALGTSKEFRYARSLMPLSRGDTIWLYLSDAFFRNLTAPHYRVEMARRLQAVADIELVQLAKLASATENKPGDTIEQLMSAGLLPPEFGPLPDGSHTVIGKGEVYDSLRGHRGSFLPIPDMPVDKLSRAEAAEYQRFADFYRAQWGQMDPMIAGIKRNALKDNREQVVADVLMSPFAPQHFTVLRQWLGPADQNRLAPIAGNMGSLELALTSQHLFGGLRDIGPPSNAGVSSLFPLGKLRDMLVGYVGTTGDLGVLSFLNIGFPPGSDPAGYATSPLGGWRWQSDPFTVFSFQRETLETVVPQLRFEQAARPAQIRLWVGDVANARLTPVLNDLGYARTRETSLNNLRFLHALDEQLHVPPASCLEAAEFLMDAKLICPLGGKYVLKNGDGVPPHWASTALEHVEPGGFLRVHAPAGYQSPPLSWFRGLDLEATMTEKDISAHAEIIMQMPAKPPAAR